MKDRKPVYPRHHSVPQGMKLRPRNMEKLRGMTPQQSECLERNALSIFTDCTNANMTFRDALSAVLLSGMHWGMEISKELK